MLAVQRITSRNARFQQWESLLTNRNKRQRAGEFLVQGVRPISLAVRHGWPVHALVSAHRCRAAAFLIVASLAGVAACSGGGGAKPMSSGLSGSAGVPASTSPSAETLGTRARTAVSVVDEFTPAGYTASSVASGYDWAAHSGQQISESLRGDHLFQIACTGGGRIKVTVAPDTHGRIIGCGEKAVVFLFSGKIDAVVDGEPANKGVFAWRIIAKK